MAKVALVTGCSTGLGRALAEGLHGQLQDGRNTYRVFASARKISALAELQAAGIECVQLDVTCEQSVKKAVQDVLDKAGRIDIVVNNAGLSRIGPLVEQPLEEVQEVLDTNVMGVLRVTQAVVPGMIARRSGLVVMIGSVGSHLSSPFAGAYNASKAALLTLSDTLRLELAPYGVGCTYVMAGSIRSSISENAAKALRLERFEAAGSAYRPYIEGIKTRVMASQDPTTIQTAEATATQIIAVTNRYFQAGGRRPPPIWFLAGGKALFYWTVGLLQKLVGWPTNAMLLRMFGLNKLPDHDD